MRNYFAENIHELVLKNRGHAMRLFLNCFLAYSAFAMTILTYVVLR